MKKVISLVMAVALCLCTFLSISALSFSDETAGEEIYVTVITPNDEKYSAITAFRVYNENGGRVTTRNLTSEITDDSQDLPVPVGQTHYLGSAESGECDEYIVWSFTFTLGTAGKERLLLGVPVTADGEMTNDTFEMMMTVHHQKEEYIPMDLTIGENIPFYVITPNTGDYSEIKSFRIYNENGGKVTLRSLSYEFYDEYPFFPGSTEYQYLAPDGTYDGSNGYIVWTLGFSVCTSGNRSFKVVPVTKSGEMTDKTMEYDCYVHYEETSKDILSASFSSDTVNTGEVFAASVRTGSRVKLLNIYNEKGSKMGKKLTSKHVNNDASVTWNYEMTIGTAGERCFTVMADNNFDTEVYVFINVVDGDIAEPA